MTDVLKSGTQIFFPKTILFAHTCTAGMRLNAYWLECSHTHNNCSLYMVNTAFKLASNITDSTENTLLKSTSNVIFKQTFHAVAILYNTIRLGHSLSLVCRPDDSVVLCLRLHCTKCLQSQAVKR